MSIDLCDYDRKAREAVKVFWGTRESAQQRQAEAGRADAGGRCAAKPQHVGNSGAAPFHPEGLRQRRARQRAPNMRLDVGCGLVDLGRQQGIMFAGRNVEFLLDARDRRQPRDGWLRRHRNDRPDIAVHCVTSFDMDIGGKMQRVLALS